MKIVINIFLLFYGFFASSLIVKLGFAWFISPMFDLHPITMVHALAIVLFYNCFPHGISVVATQTFYENTLKASEKEELEEKKIYLRLIIPWLTLGIIFLLHLLFDAIWL